jgi:hypothetical protein
MKKKKEILSFSGTDDLTQKDFEVLSKLDCNYQGIHIVYTQQNCLLK